MCVCVRACERERADLRLCRCVSLAAPVVWQQLGVWCRRLRGLNRVFVCELEPDACLLGSAERFGGKRGVGGGGVLLASGLRRRRDWKTEAACASRRSNQQGDAAPLSSARLTSSFPSHLLFLLLPEPTAAPPLGSSNPARSSLLLSFFFVCHLVLFSLSSPHVAPLRAVSPLHAGGRVAALRRIGAETDRFFFTLHTCCRRQSSLADVTVLVCVEILQLHDCR